MTPYYQDDFVTLYHGDCRDVLPSLTDIDLIVTSPPYNLSHNKGSYSRGGLWAPPGGGITYDTHTDDLPLSEYVNWQKDILTKAWDCLSDRGAIYYNHKPRVHNKTLWNPLEVNPGLPVRQIVIWDRGNGFNFSPTHYMPMHEWIVIFAKEHWGLSSRGASGVGDVWRIAPLPEPDHPAPFPIGIPAQAIETTKPRTVLDPFSGIGTTIRAAKDAGVKAIGIEVSERYCELTARRLSQEAFNLEGL